MTNTRKIPNRPRGGRGLKAPYPTIVVRIPEALREAIQDIVYEFYNADKDIDHSIAIDTQSQSSKKLTEVTNYISTFKNDNKVTKSKLKLHELVTGLEAIINAD